MTGTALRRATKYAFVAEDRFVSLNASLSSTALTQAVCAAYPYHLDRGMTGRPHAAPQEGCSCGFYGWKPYVSQGANMYFVYDGIAAVEMDVEFGGKIIVHDLGYRAEWQAIRECRTGRCCATMSVAKPSPLATLYEVQRCRQPVAGFAQGQSIRTVDPETIRAGQWDRYNASYRTVDRYAWTPLCEDHILSHDQLQTAVTVEQASQRLQVPIHTNKRWTVYGDGM